ncbi:hypothetical protein RISK_000365 [Rhodopirellula islandica]|uniref:Uncharacterized protein n=1 Tax=Rhodopirellula islandica TaxID=595434 RepID=A0A0J1BLA3_RHOIS|nr:hypothetical protein RISK_000365 [Rhodopirellula islandica]
MTANAPPCDWHLGTKIHDDTNSINAGEDHRNNCGIVLNEFATTSSLTIRWDVPKRMHFFVAMSRQRECRTRFTPA